MLTNKDIVEVLEAVGYSEQEIINFAFITKEDIEKMMKDEQIDAKVEEALNNFFRMNMEEADIKEFANDQYKNTHLIMTPTGFKKVEEFVEEGLQHCYEIKFKGFNTIATDKKSFKNKSGKWITADKVKVGDILKVFDDECEVINVTEVGDINCCSIVVEGDEYYIDGVVSK